MDAGGIGGGANGERTGARVLALLATPLTARILLKLSEGPKRLVELRRETGSPPQTTLRARLKELGQVGAVAKRRLHPFPSIREYVLAGQRGRELRFVATTLEGWLARAPHGPLPLGSSTAQAAVKALLEGWSSTMLRALGDRPLTLTELNGLVRSLDYPALERRLAAMRLARQVEPRQDRDDGTPYAVTEWLRQGVAPLAAAVRWERHHLPGETARIAPLDVEAGFLLALPLLGLSPEFSGSCRMGVEFAEGGESSLAGVTVGVEAGRIASCATRLDGSPSAWVTGPASAWLRVAIEADPGKLELGGEERLALALLDGLNKALFVPTIRSEPPTPQ